MRGQRFHVSFDFTLIRSFERQRDSQKEIFHLIVQFPNGHNCQGDSCVNWEPGISSWSLAWVVGPAAFEPFVLPFQTYQQDAEWENEEMRLKLASMECQHQEQQLNLVHHLV